MTKTTFGLDSLESNEDLFAYLHFLKAELGSVGEFKLVDLVGHAQAFASGSPSEFLHEVKVALETVMQESKALSQEHVQQVSAVITQIDMAFDAIGGA